MALIDSGVDTPGKANIDGFFSLYVNLPGNAPDGTVRGGGAANAGDVAFLSEVDAGTVTGSRLMLAPEVNQNYQLRVSQETLLDSEILNYVAQNTGKHNFVNTTMLATWSASGFLTNSSNLTTTTIGLRLRTYAAFPLYGATTTYFEATGSLSAAQAPSNTVVDVGGFIDSGANPFTPTNGAYFRFDAAGLFGVINENGVEVATSPLNFTPVANTKYKFLIEASDGVVGFWINDVLYGRVRRPAAQGQVFTAVAVPFAVRHAIVGGAAGAAFSFTLSDYTVSLGGGSLTTGFSQQGNRAIGSHQGLGGGVMGSLANYVNSTNPTPLTPTNTTAAAGSIGLGGQTTINAPVGAVTDLIVMSYQLPAATALLQGRRLALYGVRIQAVNLGAVVATTPTTLAFSLAWGHTAVSLATAEAATTKAPRREAIGIQSWAIGAAIGDPAREGVQQVTFTQPIYVNPGEFLQTVAKALVGSATASQAIYLQVSYDYGWE